MNTGFDELYYKMVFRKHNQNLERIAYRLVFWRNNNQYFIRKKMEYILSFNEYKK